MLDQRWSFVLGLVCSSMVLSGVAYSKEDSQKIERMPEGVTSQPTGVITPPVAPYVRLGAEFVLSGDFIYWQAQQDGLDFAFSGGYGYSTPNPSTGEIVTIVPSSSSIKQAPRAWEPGFKMGVGMDFAHDGWDFFAQWTWLNPITSNKKSVTRDTSDSSAVLSNIPNRTAIGVTTAGNNNKITGAWGLRYNVIDLELGRNFFLSRYLTYRPHIGLKSAWIKQTFDTHFHLKSDTSSTGGLLELVLSDQLIYGGGVFKEDQSLKSWGLGIRTGIDPVWHFTKNWGLYGNLALSAMYQYYSAELTFNGYDTSYVASDGTGSGTAFPVPSPMEVVDTKRSNHTVTPVLELGLGLEYMAWFYDEMYMLELKAGWEEQVWFNTNRFIDAMSTGNLTLQGFTFKACFHF